MIANWGENSAQTRWKIRMGKQWWDGDLPWRVRKKHPNFMQDDCSDEAQISTVYTLFVNKEQTMENKDIIDSHRIYEECYGNVGVYNLENRYYCTGLLILNNQLTLDEYQKQVQERQRQLQILLQRQKEKELAEKEEKKEKEKQKQHQWVKKTKNSKEKKKFGLSDYVFISIWCMLVLFFIWVAIYGEESGSSNKGKSRGEL